MEFKYWDGPSVSHDFVFVASSVPVPMTVAKSMNSRHALVKVLSNSRKNGGSIVIVRLGALLNVRSP